MFLRHSSRILLIATITLPALAGKDDFRFMQTESIGALRIGLSRNHVLRTVGSNPTAGPIELWDADGNYHQQLKFPAQGIKVYLVSHSQSAAQSVESICVTAPCTLATKRGIRIGSSERDVVNSYKSHQNKEESEPGFTFVAGTTYGGLIFQFKDGRVSQIFLGPASE